jgi:hypothetical protein
MEVIAGHRFSSSHPGCAVVDSMAIPDGGQVDRKPV